LSRFYLPVQHPNLACAHNWSHTLQALRPSANAGKAVQKDAFLPHARILRSVIPNNWNAAILPSKISSLSSGEFVGMVADDPDNKIELKTFHSSILNDHEALKKEQRVYKPIPVVRQINASIIQKNYLQIKQEIEDLVIAEMERIMNDPAGEGMVLKKNYAHIFGTYGWQ
jgi:hypothetical protein